MAEIQPFYAMDLLAKARQMEQDGRSIIHMEVGEPDFITPDPILEAGKQALQQGETHYTPALGLSQLREKIAQFYQDQHGVTVAPERVVITPGASGALMLALGVMIDPGDEVLMADPGYPCNRHFVRLYEGQAKGIPVSSETAYQLTAELLADNWTDRTVAAMLASPSNPTGTLVGQQSLQAMNQVVQQNNGVLLVDEIYQGLTYTGESQKSALVCSDDLFVINSFSKYFSMTGWRLGWLVVPDAYLDVVDRLAQNIFLAAPTLAQHAALAAFSDETMAILEQRRCLFEQRRNYLLPALQSLGFVIDAEPEGAFYLYANCEAFTHDSAEFAERLLDEAGVAVTPGKDFGNNRPEHYLRFAYTTSMENLQEAVERIGNFLQKSS